MRETGTYIFCGIQTDKPIEGLSVELEGEKRELYTIHYKDAAIVAAKAPMKIYHPKKDNLLMHQKVVSQVMEQNDTVIPVSFGNVFKTDDDVTVLLENLYPQFAKLFPEIKGKIEVGLKAIGKQEWLEQQARENPEISKAQKSAAGKSEAAAYYDRIKLGGAAQNLFKSLQKEMEREMFEPLNELAVASKKNDPISEKMLLNAAFLIDRDKEEAFDQKVNAIHDKWQDRIDFSYSGPWAAYNFVNIKLTVEDG